MGRALNNRHSLNALRWRFRLVSPVPAHSDGKSGAPIRRWSIKETSRLATSIEELCEEIRASARREEFPIDVPVYERFKKDPFQPILYAGSLEAPVCIFGATWARTRSDLASR